MEKFPFDVAVHLMAPAPTGQNQVKVVELRDKIKSSGAYDELWCTDHTLTLFLIARNFNVEAAHAMMMFAHGWRSMRKAHLVELQPNWIAKMSRESETGKIWCPGSDQWGRPIVIFDNTVQNTNSVDDQMLFLAWCLEFSIKEMPDHTDKYIVFMHLSNFSFFNNPPFAATKETAQMLCNCFPERAGHIVLYQPPFIFEAFYNSIQYLIDPKTRAKVVFIRGEDGPGSVNNEKLVQIIGLNWRELTGAGKEPIPHQISKYGNTSPGYDHDQHWVGIHKRIAARPKRHRIYTRDGAVIDNPNFRENEVPSDWQSKEQQGGVGSPPLTISVSKSSARESLDDSRMIDSSVYYLLENAHNYERTAPTLPVNRSSSHVFVVSSTPPPASPNNRAKSYKYVAPAL